MWAVSSMQTLGLQPRDWGLWARPCAGPCPGIGLVAGVVSLVNEEEEPLPGPGNSKWSLCSVFPHGLTALQGVLVMKLNFVSSPALASSQLCDCHAVGHFRSRSHGLWAAFFPPQQLPRFSGAYLLVCVVGPHGSWFGVSGPHLRMCSVAVSCCPQVALTHHEENARLRMSGGLIGLSACRCHLSSLE